MISPPSVAVQRCLPFFEKSRVVCQPGPPLPDHEMSVHGTVVLPKRSPDAASHSHTVPSPDKVATHVSVRSVASPVDPAPWDRQRALTDLLAVLCSTCPSTTASNVWPYSDAARVLSREAARPRR